MDEQEVKDQKKVPSSEILIAIPAKKRFQEVHYLLRFGGFRSLSLPGE
jgi:hypothetical protein